MSEFLKAERCEEKGDYGKAAIHYRNGWQKENDSYGYFHMMRLGLQHPNEVARALGTTADDIISDALVALFHRGDYGKELVATYYIDRCTKLSYTDRYKKVQECLDTMSSKSGSNYSNVVRRAADLKSKADAQKKERKNYIFFNSK